MSINLAALLASLALVILGAKILLKANFFNLDVFFNLVAIAGSGAIVFGLLGFFIGRIIESSRPKKIKRKADNSELLIDDLLVYDIGIEKKEVKEKID